MKCVKQSSRLLGMSILFTENILTGKIQKVIQS